MSSGPQTSIAPSPPKAKCSSHLSQAVRITGIQRQAGRLPLVVGGRRRRRETWTRALNQAASQNPSWGLALGPARRAADLGLQEHGRGAQVDGAGAGLVEQRGLQGGSEAPDALGKVVVVVVQHLEHEGVVNRLARLPQQARRQPWCRAWLRA